MITQSEMKALESAGFRQANKSAWWVRGDKEHPCLLYLTIPSRLRVKPLLQDLKEDSERVRDREIARLAHIDRALEALEALEKDEGEK